MNKMFTQPTGPVAKQTNKQAIARTLAIKQSAVGYLSTDAAIGGYTVLYDKDTQTSWFRGDATGTPTSWTITDDVMTLVTGDGTFELSITDLRTNLASQKDGMGSELLGFKQTFADSVARTQQDKNSESMSLMDLGESRNSLDPLEIEQKAREQAVILRIPYLGYDQQMLPGMGLKVFKYCDGPYDRAPVVSIRNMMDPADTEPQSSIAGFASASALALNSERGAASLYIHHVGQPVLLNSTNTTFTENTVTCSDLTEEILTKVRVKQFINVIDGTTTYSSFVKSVSGTTITVETAWYIVGTSSETGIPTNGSTFKLVPNNKSWAANIISSLNESSDASSFVGIELNNRNNKQSASGGGYGLDVVSNGAYNIGQGVQVRGACVFGFRNYTHNMYGFANTPEAGNLVYGFYDTSSTNGVYVWNNAYGLTAKNSSNYSIRVLDNDNNFQTGTGPTGSWQRFKLYATTTAVGGTISSLASLSFINPTEDGTTVAMAPLNAGHVLRVKNRSTLYSLTLTGSFENGAGSFTIPAGNTIEFYCDGTYWFDISKRTS